MPDPVFNESDRVPTTQLPTELKGVTDPLKIAAYYQQREGALRDEMRRTPPRTVSTMERPVGDPPEERQPANFSIEEATAARGTLMATARNAAKVGKEYWDRLSVDIEKLMAEQPPENQVSVHIWETCYHTLLGMNMQRLQREDGEKAALTARTLAERATPPADQQAPPAPLPIEVTGKILPGLNLSEEQYRTAQDNIAAGKWPLTAENVSGKRIPIGGIK
jgi:hypothetical protein